MTTINATAVSELMPLLSLVLTGAAYAVRARTLAGEAHAVPAGRQVSFYLGLLAIAAGAASPLDAAADDSLIAHTSAHMLVGQIGAFFVVLGLTGGVIAPLLRIGWVANLRRLSDPRVAFPLWAVNLFLWHTPALFDLALANDFCHALEHGLFLALGINLWMPLVGPLPQPRWFGNAARLGYVVLVFFSMMILGNVLVWSGSVFYESYRGPGNHWGLSALADQSVAGGVMMIVDTVFTMGLLAWLFMRTAREHEASQELVEYARERGVELSHERSSRAAAAGTTEHLRRHVERSGEAAERDRR